MGDNQFKAEISEEVQRTKKAAHHAAHFSSKAQAITLKSDKLEVSHQASLAAAAAEGAAKQAADGVAIATASEPSAAVLDQVKRAADLAQAEQKYATQAYEAAQKIVESDACDNASTHSKSKPETKEMLPPISLMVFRKASLSDIRSLSLFASSFNSNSISVFNSSPLEVRA